MGVALTGDLFNMYVFLEIMSGASYGLAAWMRTKRSLEGSIKLLIVGATGTSLVLLGIAFMYGLTGTLSMADMALKLRAAQGYGPALGLIMAGLLIKAAAFPFHGWKPDAVEGTVTPVAGLISAVSTSVGVYAVLRVLFLFDALSFSWLLVGIGVASMAGGALMALMQDELKRLLAYSSISQVGYVLFSIGLGGAGLAPGLFHLFNNALSKVMLFLVTGIILYHTGTSRLDRLGGLGRSLPLSAACFGIGALSVVGIPGTAGFASKLMIYMAAWQASPALAVLPIVVSAVTLAYYLKAFSCAFLGPQNRELHIRRRTPRVMLAPILALAGLILLFGILPDLALSFIQPAAEALGDLPGYVSAVLAG
jgi:multicomponent Na+:H+ antiporter subunit D